MRDEPGMDGPGPALPGEGRIEVEVDPEIFDLVPIFLEKRRQDLNELRVALEEADQETIRALGHKMKGMGGSYGFHHVSRVGIALEEAAEEGALARVSPWLDGLEDYLNRVEAVEGDPEDLEEWEY